MSEYAPYSNSKTSESPTYSTKGQGMTGEMGKLERMTALDIMKRDAAKIAELTKELDAYKAEDTPAFEEVCMRNQEQARIIALLTAERDALAKRVWDLEEVIDTALSVASAAPEINPSNYDHDQVCDLNGAAVEVHSILYNARKEQP